MKKNIKENIIKTLINTSEFFVLVFECWIIKLKKINAKIIIDNITNSRYEPYS